jgi:hypothetical protein
MSGIAALPRPSVRIGEGFPRLRSLAVANFSGRVNLPRGGGLPQAARCGGDDGPPRLRNDRQEREAPGSANIRDVCDFAALDFAILSVVIAVRE